MPGLWKKQQSFLPQTMVGINKGHGAISMQEMQIPWIIAGPGIRKNNEVKESVMTFDTAATIAAIFRLKQPQVWIGRPVTASFR
jgi:arylsulfatase A-like enzyme